jgi:hypothetical protein
LDFGADWADEANRPDGIKMLRIFLQNWCNFVGGRLPRLQLPPALLPRYAPYSALCPLGKYSNIRSLGKTSKVGDLIYSFPLNKLLQNAAHFIVKAPVMWEGRYMDLPLLGGI